MKTDLFSATEALKIFRQLKDQKLEDGMLALKIFDMVDALTRKAIFLEEEVNKIISAYKAQPLDTDHQDMRLVVKREDKTVDEEATKKFIDEVVAIRQTDVEFDIPLFTMDEINSIMKVYKMTPAELGQIRFAIDEKPKADPEPVVELFTEPEVTIE